MTTNRLDIDQTKLDASKHVQDCKFTGNENCWSGLISSVQRSDFAANLLLAEKHSSWSIEWRCVTYRIGALSILEDLLLE